MVASLLREFCRCRCRNQMPGQASRESHPLTLNTAARPLEPLHRVRKTAKIDPEILQNGVRVFFDRRQTFFAKHFEGSKGAHQEGNALAGSRTAHRLTPSSSARPAPLRWRGISHD